MCDIANIFGQNRFVDLFIFENDLENSSRLIKTLNFTKNLSGKPVALLNSASFKEIDKKIN